NPRDRPIDLLQFIGGVGPWNPDGLCDFGVSDLSQEVLTKHFLKLVGGKASHGAFSGRCDYLPATPIAVLLPLPVRSMLDVQIQRRKLFPGGVALPAVNHVEK